MKISEMLSLITPIEKFIVEHGSSVTLRDNVALLRDHIMVLSSKIDELNTQNSALRSENESLHAGNAQLAHELAELKKGIEGEGDICPYCKRKKGELLRLERHPIFGEVGVKIGYYKCAACGQEYDRQHDR